MSVFNCTKCGVIENTALGHYWCCDVIFFKEGSISPELVGKPLCSECIPLEFSDGSRAGTGKWHGKFEKKYEKLPLTSS